MKALVVYYSRTGTTKKVAELLAKELNCDIEEIRDDQNRMGVIGYLKSGMEASLKKLPWIDVSKHNSNLYDVVIIGTPVWAMNMSSPVRSYINKNKGLIKNAVFFCTMGGSGDENTFSSMEKLIEKKAVSLFSIKTADVMNEEFNSRVSDFSKEIKKVFK